MGRRKRNGKKGSSVRKSAHELRFYAGHKIKVPNHPPEFVSQPWFNLTVRISNPSLIVDLGKVFDSLAVQLAGLNLATAGNCLARIFAVEVWGPIPTTNMPLNVRFYDIFDHITGSQPSGPLTIQEITDYADQVNRARVGYRYSTAQQQAVVLLATGSTDRLCYVTGGGNGSVMYIRLVWRPQYASAPPGLEVEDSLSEASVDFESVPSVVLPATSTARPVSGLRRHTVEWKKDAYGREYPTPGVLMH